MLMGYNDGSNDMERLYNHIGSIQLMGRVLGTHACLKAPKIAQDISVELVS